MVVVLFLGSPSSSEVWGVSGFFWGGGVGVQDKENHIILTMCSCLWPATRQLEG